MKENPTYIYESGENNSNARLNWLRAAVLGANDGLISVAAIVVGVAATQSSTQILLITGIAALVAGSLSMALGEYVSVSSQRDSELATLEKERRLIEHFPEEELAELTKLYEDKGLSHETAVLVATELTKRDAFAAHVDAEHGIDPDDLTSPIHAAIASALSFIAGGFLPLLPVIFSPVSIRIQVMFVCVFIGLVITGLVSGHFGGANKTRATLRVVIGGILAMIITFGIGSLFGVHRI
jgi:vacuolar iron transporter family protein